MKYRTLFKLWFPILLLFGCTSCASTKVSDGFRFSTEFWGGNANKPLLEATTADDVPLRLLFDTGGTQAILFKSGLSKFMEKTKSTADYSKDYDIDTVNLFLDGHAIGKTHFRYRGQATGYDEGNIDGIIGFSAIPSCQRILLDYRSKTVSINGPKLQTTALPYTRPVGLENLFLVDIERDGHLERAAIDTGNSLFTVASAISSDGDLLSYPSASEILERPAVELTQPRDIVVNNMRIGDLALTNLHAVLASDRRLKTSDYARKILSVYTSLGYSVLHDHRIQFDFEEHSIRID